MIVEQGKGHTAQAERLHRFMAAVSEVVADAGELTIDETLNRAAAQLRVTPSQVKYALTFAEDAGLVVIDFDTAAVRTPPTV